MERYREWPYPDDVREGLRRAALSDHRGDLWVFAYGPLIWDPAFHFEEVRRARVRGYARRMNLLETRGGRGTEDAPGLMASLSAGTVCDGVVFRIAEDLVEAETEILFRREMIAPGYLAQFVTATLDDGEVSALAFVADPKAEDVLTDLSYARQVEMIATGEGFLGSSRDYLAGIVAHFDVLGIEDTDCATLLRDVDLWKTRAETGKDT
jgi:cation transport protein ChaC